MEFLRVRRDTHAKGKEMIAKDGLKDLVFAGESDLAEGVVGSRP